MKKFIFSLGLLLLLALPAAAQSTAQVERDHPLEAPTPENTRYREEQTPKDHTGISKDPKWPDPRRQAIPPAAPKTDSVVPADEKKKPQR